MQTNFYINYYYGLQETTFNEYSIPNAKVHSLHSYNYTYNHST